MIKAWEGKEWQDYCMQLVQERHTRQGKSHSLQIVPDRDQGDLGLEAFSHEGFAYQCYAAQAPYTNKQLYDKQRDKLTRDLQKLVDKKDAVKKMLDKTKMHKYVFMVPEPSSRLLINHANKKIADLIDHNLPFIDENCLITIETLNDYKNEREKIHALPKQLVEYIEPNSSHEVAWVEDNSDLRQTALNKLRKVTSDKNLSNLLNTLINEYVNGENLLEKIKNTAPETHQGILSTKSAKENRLAFFQYSGTNYRSINGIPVIADKLADELRKDFPTLNIGQANSIAWSTVADWLMRCPLDFEVNNE